eukprot:CAMPEP_0173469132 /NCGR_PEP_ID=MMETSP1357-20121228/77204_1 /TAXON_ID=77926 /ORGANISM="Hemiselmis rufescens, Strain PCC563" /LENGTH=112 /DNA_ID=CAMNT_0014437363 /DNA_START=1159 /DNA_END=1497 /DNA_ORIENTATION=+
MQMEKTLIHGTRQGEGIMVKSRGGLKTTRSPKRGAVLENAWAPASGNDVIWSTANMHNDQEVEGIAAKHAATYGAVAPSPSQIYCKGGAQMSGVMMQAFDVTLPKAQSPNGS